MAIQLRFLNQSNDPSGIPVVLFQKNAVTGPGGPAPIAWLVIENCRPGDSRDFTFPATLEIAASDSFGNYSPRLEAQPGQSFSVVCTDSGDQLVATEEAVDPGNIVLVNALQEGTINANLFRDGRLLAAVNELVPQQVAVFGFPSTIWIGAAWDVGQGGEIDPAVVAQINTELELTDLASADIVMTGGGSGPDAWPFAFELENIQHGLTAERRQDDGRK